MKYKAFVLLILAALCSAVFAQFIVKPDYMETSGVSNSGMVAGYETWAGPYLLWNPDTGTTEYIGGVAPGNGVGGMARFSGDGNLLSGSCMADIPVSMEWERNTLSEFNFIFMGMDFPASENGFIGFAGGQSLTYNGHGIVIGTYDGGNTWSALWTDDQNRGIEALSFPTGQIGYVGGWNQYFAKTIDGGWGWEQLDPAGTDPVYIYTAIEFKDELNGMVAAQLDNGVGVYITSDGGATWTEGSGLSGVPSAIVHVSGDTYYLADLGGHVQKSVNNGLTWTTVHTFPGALLMGLGFYDDQTGIALGEGYIYKTSNGGQNWTSQAVGPDPLWRDVAWLDAQNIIICGTPDVIYESHNGGSTWEWANEETSNFGPALYTIAKGNNKLHVCGSQGTFYKRMTVSSLPAAEMALYDVATDSWTPLGHLGFNVDGCVSSGWSISGDGSTVVGNSWASPAHAQGVVWNSAEGFMDLGTLFPGDNRSTRAEAVSYDGQVVAGYQDFNGWKAAVWRKNPAGGYFPNEYLLVDPNGSPTDENNQLGMALAVSGDGNWIGGFGDWASNGEPWLWSESTGYVGLGAMENAWNASVTGLSYDGSIAVGYYDFGGWDPRVPFIRTAANGTQNFNDYISQTLGIDTGGIIVYTPMDISPNGRYIVGSGFDPNAGEWGQIVAFRLELPGSAIDEPTPPVVKSALKQIYPNPFRESATLDFALEQKETVSLAVYNSRGQLVRQLLNGETGSGEHSIVWDGCDSSGAKVATGVYYCRLQGKGWQSSRKILLVK